MKSISWKGKISLFTLLCMLISILPVAGADIGPITENSLGARHFKLQNQLYLEADDCYLYHFVHQTTGASVVFKDNKSIKKNFSITFASPAKDDKGENHVLEHALLSGSQTYPTKNLFYILQGSSAATMLNGFTMDDAVSYVFETKNTKDYDNLLGIYLDMVFNPLLKTEKNLFLREGIRREFAEGKARYNGVVYNEMRSGDNMIGEAIMMSIKELFPDSVPGYDPGGDTEAIKSLTYEEVMDTYHTYYKPSNSVTMLSGAIDLEKSLAVLDQYFSKMTEEKPKQTYEKPAVIPEQKLAYRQSKRFGGDASCVVSTIVGPAVTNTKDYMAASILMDAVMNEFCEQHSETYISLGDGNGVMTGAVGAADVSKEQGEQFIKEYLNCYQTKKGMSKEAITKMVRDYQKRQESYGDEFSISIRQAIRGFVYLGDPLRFYGTDLYDTLCMEDTAYFDDILERYFIENPYQFSAIYSPNPNADGSNRDEIQASPEELEKIKQETVAYEAWATAPDSPEVLARIPKLEPEDFEEMPYDFQTDRESVDGIPYDYSTSSIPRKKESAILSFDLSPLNTEEVQATQMAAKVIARLLKAQKVDGIWMQVTSNPARYDGSKLKPTLDIRIDASGQEVIDKIQTLKNILSAPDFFTPESIQPMISELCTQAKETAEWYYMVDVWMGERSESSRWNRLAGGASGEGSYEYYTYVKRLMENGSSSGEDAIRSVKEKVFNRNQLTVFFQGSEETRQMVKTEIPGVASVLSEEETQSGNVILPEEKYSVNLIEDSRKVAAVYLLGRLSPYRGQMQVMAKVLNGKYLLPELRGKGGAYGAQAEISSDGSFYANGARIPNITAAIEVINGMGNYLKNLTLTQEELDQYIIAAISQLDDNFLEWCTNFARDSKLNQYTLKDVARERQEILSTTVEDLRSFAEAIDKIVAEQRMFLFANQALIEQSGIQARHTEKMQDLFGENKSQDPVTHKAYIFGMESGLFEPERTLTRAEAAALLSRVLEVGEGEAAASFSDVDPQAWYAPAIDKLYRLNLMMGFGDGTFRPEDVITGEEFALIASRVGSVPETFEIAEGPVTRADAVRIINAILGRQGETVEFNGMDTVKFADVPADHPAYRDIIEASTSHRCELLNETERWVGLSE